MRFATEFKLGMDRRSPPRGRTGSHKPLQRSALHWWRSASLVAADNSSSSSS
eukprot:CAMPEP_0172885750 /NCGR_PEP_ID=MMETSP1075-20121228/129023_1 /TAXON_ID=2916 /ORGANISM="Ceratium fusus, Strain PA161109" /LENGTH=51 /DNA_ID=CAMNT_0013739115 /DNA_START=33 /DNA_END=185 /DNA_ORIENTATION=-